jgi:hypothetical protein
VTQELEFDSEAWGNVTVSSRRVASYIIRKMILRLLRECVGEKN